MESSTKPFGFPIIVLLGLLGFLFSNCGDKDNGSPTADGAPSQIETDGLSGISGTENPQGAAGLDNRQGVAGVDNSQGE